MIARLIKKIWSKAKRKDKDSSLTLPDKNISADLEENLVRIGDILSQSSDLIIRRFNMEMDPKLPAAIVYIDGLADKTVINEHILRPLMIDTIKLKKSKPDDASKNIPGIEKYLVTVNDLSRQTCLKKLIDAVLNGDTVLLIEGSTEALQISSKGWAKRSITEPEAEIVLKGPREGFIEDLRTNTALLRRKIGDPMLTFEALRVGTKTRTDINLAYIKGIVRADLIKEVHHRLEKISSDAILSSEYISEFLEDAPFSIFSTTTYTERPDVVAAKLLEGRVAFFVDGTPIVVTVPTLFFENFQSPDDYNIRPFYASLIRIVRFISFTITILLPAGYVALTTFHQELIPTPLLITISGAADKAPFPAAIEVIVMGVIFELLREAGIRMPRPFGPSVSIVGGLVIGEAAVGAGLIGEPTVIVIALTAIASYVVPFQAEVGVFLRLFMVILSGCFGFYGVYYGLLLILIHLASLRSFGVPYFSPLTPLEIQDFKDIFIRFPHWAMLKRPRTIAPQDLRRQRTGLRPKPPRDEED